MLIHKIHEFDLAYCECIPLVGFTHYKKQNKGYSKPKHTYDL